MSYSDTDQAFDQLINLLTEQRKAAMEFAEKNHEQEIIDEVDGFFDSLVCDLRTYQETNLEKWQEEYPSDFDDGTDDASMRAWHHSRVL